jgi:osmotically-inducible protein OsmY
MKCLPLLLLTALALCGCDRTHTTSPPTSPDNTGVNVRDRDGEAKTPIDQNENRTDIDITAEIRRRVVDTKMSIDAQNVKIITQDGKVTLRGPVKSADEKKQIEEMAHAVAGADKVDSQLEVAP